MPLAVLLADDHEFIRQSIKSLLHTDPDIRVVAEASTLREAMRLAKEFLPDVVVLDLHMGDEAGIDPIEVKAAFAGMRLVVVSIWDVEETKVLAAAYGAAATVDKASLGKVLMSAVRPKPQ
jgi:DNA-binding NarL/FixJ family response regulator